MVGKRMLSRTDAAPVAARRTGRRSRPRLARRRTTAAHVPRRGELRRSRCVRQRRGGQAGHRPRARDDFQLLEDGKPQMVSAFSYVNIPIARAERPLFSPTPPSSRTSRPTSAWTAGSIWSCSTICTSTSRGPSREETRCTASSSATSARTTWPPSSSRADARPMARTSRTTRGCCSRRSTSSSGRKLRSPTLERLDEYNRQQTGGLRNAGDPVNDPVGVRACAATRATCSSRCGSCRTSWRASTGVARRWCWSARGSTTTSTTCSTTTRRRSTIIDATRDAIAAATRANVSIYAIDPRGLVTPGGDLIEASGAAADEPNLGLGVPSALDELRLSQDSLRELADETGGFAVVNRNNVDEAFDRIVAREQQLLRARLLPGQRPARRPVPQDRGPRDAARPDGARAPRLRRAARPRRPVAPGVDGPARRGAAGGRREPAADERHSDAAVCGALQGRRRRTRRSRLPSS